MPIHRLVLAAAAGLLSSSLAIAQSDLIRLNQVGYPISQPKYALYRGSESNATVVNANNGTFVANVNVGPIKSYTYIGKVVDSTCRVLDFSGLTTPGTYRIKVGSELSHPFEVSVNPYLALSKATIKAFWYNRSGYTLPTTYAGKWARAKDPNIDAIVHASAATTKRPAGSTIKSSGGWFDAGDYGKYVVNSGISTWTLLHLYESEPAYSDTLKLNVAPRTNGTSDLVDEILWNLRWMLTMQDPNDGGVYHKLTTTAFPDIKTMPVADTMPRYVVQKGTAATLDFAAVTAYSARLFRDHATLKPLADSCLNASLAAWNWARANPDSSFSQMAMNNAYSPDFSTGEYPDGGDLEDEFYWAASELFLTTQQDSFAVAGKLTTAPFSYLNSADVPTTWPNLDWGDVGTLGWISLLSNKPLLTSSLSGIGPRLDSSLLAMVGKIRDNRAINPYRVLLGNFVWGSNGSYANKGLLLWKAWQITQDTSYRNASLDALDYLLGRNATGYSFVTGFGSQSPLKPHHRPSVADTVLAPVPGFMVGGPNNTTTLYLGPVTYTDAAASYKTNEVTINWNAPIAFLSGVWSAYLPTSTDMPSGISSSRHAARMELNAHNGLVSARIPGAQLARLEILAVDGRRLASVDGSHDGLQLSTTSKGLILVRATTTTGQSATARALLP